ncbi:hypothetical protein [Uliginosibacterium sp. H1]|uniref:hypothetical protein n=1 Tax=Uliginosibacterium sp. H1 TaxID=3114757 RepID=UPI002E17D414|nr:hypothetical protein [Uliginosibacterium sp. H1]
MTGHAMQGGAFAAQLIALNALFESARAGEIAREEARFIAFCDGVAGDLARRQIEEVLDAICIAPLAADLDAAAHRLHA